MKTDPGSYHKFWVSKNGEKMVPEIFLTSLCIGVFCRMRVR